MKQVSSQVRLSRLRNAREPRGRGGAVEFRPLSMANYFFPDFSVNSCGFGRDYPAWMGWNGYEKHYLFRQGSECCEKYFPGKSGCPYERTKQVDYYWTSYQDNLPNSEDMPIVYNHTYFPVFFSGTCVNGYAVVCMFELPELYWILKHRVYPLSSPSCNSTDYPGKVYV